MPYSNRITIEIHSNAFTYSINFNNKLKCIVDSNWNFRRLKRALIFFYSENTLDWLKLLQLAGRKCIADVIYYRIDEMDGPLPSSSYLAGIDHLAQFNPWNYSTLFFVLNHNSPLWTVPYNISAILPFMEKSVRFFSPSVIRFKQKKNIKE